jgi:hypothetical protein
MKKAAASTFLLLVLAGCGGGGSTPQLNIAGNWQLTATSSKFGDQYEASGTFAQNGSQLSGSLDITGDPCASVAAFSGTLQGDPLNVMLDENTQEVTYMGTVTSDGNSASGSYTAPAGGCTNGDTGTWAGTRTSGGSNKTKEKQP